ncbi:Oxysterol-binding protein-domain-containing protein, partial [Amylostereum chailletii]
SFLTASYRSLLRTYVHSPTSTPPPPALIALLSSPRVRLLNLSYLDDASGTTLLHEAARRKDLRLVELAVRGGADVFVRDRRGRPVQDVVGKDDKMRVFLRQFASRDTTLIDDAPTTGPPTLKGYLNKYTNVARGYGTRWFVLEDGNLSYYRHQEDERLACRGAISMKTAVLRPASGGEKLRFEVHSTPSRGHSNVQKWYMKANHPVEASRWMQAITRAIDFTKQGQGQTQENSESDTPSKSSIRSSIRGSVSSLRSTLPSRRERSDGDSVSSSNLQPDEDSGGGGGHHLHSQQEAIIDDRQDSRSENDSSEQAETDTPPHGASFDLQGHSTAAQLDLTAQLLQKLISSDTTHVPSSELATTLKDSMATVQALMNEYVSMVKERDDWWRARLAREQERQTVWEESLQSVVKEGEALERELREQARARRRGSRAFDISESDVMGTIKGRPATLPPPPVEEEAAVPEITQSPEPIASNPFFEDSPLTTPQAHTEKQLGSRRQSSLGTARPRPLSITPTATRKFSAGGLALPPSATIPAFAGDDGDGGDTDEEDEFFDAIDANTLPNLVVNEALAGHATVPPKIDIQPYVGYQHLRTKLALTSDNRPPTSLWSVLKHSIGKDLTKISFPVFFNEPTSMLQRMAEDMEFSECLDAAAQEADPLRRIAFVAAFAMSNYSSTIGRIAKPFNPMLSETFEYVSLEKAYRYVSEQVSHHPPISACWAESPRWHYYGEVDAQNKFMGKSFEIRPTGIAHADLAIPAEHGGPTYPPSEGKKVIEHYSWKKVTTNVSGFILGSPTIDHYGDMVITNHRTKDQCILTFKPRGWRSKDAYEISGYVADANGNVQYEIAGRWNSQLVARAVGSGVGSLNPDVAVPGPGSTARARECILLWRNSEKPPAPFNLTPYAITLNDCPKDTLKPYLAPTDCRLRPDQRAFEMGKFELANELKQKQEEFQRVTRKAREEGRLPEHRPRWFRAETEGDTGERVWTPSRVNGGKLEYWDEREKVFAAGGKAPWKDVEQIFIDDQV